MRYSLLDLAPIPEGADAAQSIRNSTALAQAAEGFGFHRYWLAEHHNMPGIASSATAVMIGHIAAHTKRMRVGSGGIMLPNHSPLVIAEQFGTLAAIHGPRIDLGLGRAPGTDMETARALRRNMAAQDTFPQDVLELMAYLGDPEPGQKLHAIPGEGTKVPVWLLGSSLYGAQLAAHLGLPYAFASHFAPDMLGQAAEVYRRSFKPSEFLSAPHFMMAMNIFAADTVDQAVYLRTSMQQAFVRLRSGQPSKLPRPVPRIEDVADPAWIRAVNHALSVSATGDAAQVREQTAKLIEAYQPDEVMISGQIHDPAARIRSFEIAAEVMQSLGAEPA